MEISVSKVRKELYKLIQPLLDGKDGEIVFTRYGKPIAKMVPIARLLNRNK